MFPYKICSLVNRGNWITNDKVKVLIETNNYFSEDIWMSVLNKVINTSELEIKFFNNKYVGYKFIKDANVMFSFGDNVYYDKSNLQMQYYGLSQPDRFDNSITEVHYAKGVSCISVAEYCLTYSLILLNESVKYFKNQYRKKWHQEIIPFESSKLNNKIVGVVGLGNNGKKIAEIFKKNGCTIYGHDIIDEKYISVDFFCKKFDDLLESCDIVIVAVNLTSETKDLFNKDSFAKMKRSAFLINISRGSVINEDDLYYALKNKIIAGAALDVTVNEPLSRYSKLWKLHNLVITPHISGNINKFYLNVMEDFSSKLKLYLDKYV